MKGKNRIRTGIRITIRVIIYIEYPNSEKYLYIYIEHPSLDE